MWAPRRGGDRDWNLEEHSDSQVLMCSAPWLKKCVVPASPLHWSAVLLSWFETLKGPHTWFTGSC